jgi:transposase
MNKFINKKWVIGIDISKDYYDAALIHEQRPGSFEENRIKNSPKGFNSMMGWLKKNKVKIEDCLFCMEHTGTYGLMLFALLSKQKASFCVEPGLQIKKSLGMTRGKNDKVDARRIATYAQTNKAKLKQFSLPSEKLLQIKQLLTYRDQLVRTRSSFMNSIKSHQLYQQVNHYDFVTNDIRNQIDNLSVRIEEVENQIKEIIGSEESLNKNFNLASSVKGIGLIIAAFMLVTTNNFKSFENGRKYACYTGIAPFEHISGTTIKAKARVSHLANKKMKTLLSNGANSAKNADPEIKNYYIKKTQQGKDHKLVINAISCKLVNRVFAVVKRQSPFVTMYQQNFV